MSNAGSPIFGTPTPREAQEDGPDFTRNVRPSPHLNADGITLHLDMPGVARDRVKIDADRQTLSIEGAIQIPMAEGMEAIYAEVHSTQYRPSFTLSGELDTERVDASLNDGVLTVRIPRRAELRARKIEVRAG